MSDLSRSERSEATRARLLDAGLEALREEPAERLFERLQARAVSARAGVSTGAFYHHFDGQDSYVEALLEYSLAKDPNPPFAVGSADFERRVKEGASFAEAFIGGAGEMMRWQESRNATFALQMAVWSRAHRDLEATRRLERMYRQVDEETASYYELMLDPLGIEIRPPFSVVDLASTFSAVFEGLSLRRPVRPSTVPDDRLGMVLLASLALMTRPPDDDRAADEWIHDNAPNWVNEPPGPEGGTARSGS